MSNYLLIDQLSLSLSLKTLEKHLLLHTQVQLTHRVEEKKEIKRRNNIK